MNAWIFALLVHLAPHPYPVPSHPETADAYRTRLASIADDVAAVARGPREAALLVSIAFMETGLAADADLGPCYRGRDGKSTRCDSGLAASLWQLRIGAGSTREGWSMADVFGDRRKAATSALAMIRRSLRACKGSDAGLDAFAGGHCAPTPQSAIRKAGKARLDLARRLLAEHPYAASAGS